MGIGTHGGSVTFINVANGEMTYPARDQEGKVIKDEHKTCGYYEGYLTRVELVDDEFQGRVNKKVQLYMADPEAQNEWEKRVLIKFTLEGWYAHGFFSRIGKIDLTKPFRLGVFGSEQNEKISFCYMRQGEVKIESDKSFPRHDKEGQKYLDAVTETLNKLQGAKGDDLPF